MALLRKLALPATLVALLAAAAPAAAQDELYNDFRGDGSIDPCTYSPGQLQNGLENLPPDIQQYAPGFGDQLRSGLEAGCGGGGSAPVATGTDEDPTAVAAAGGGGGGPDKSFPAPPAPERSSAELGLPTPPVAATPTGSDAPGWVIPAVAALVALIMLGMLAASRFTGFALERVGGSLRASFADLGGRTADAFATATDFLRFGR